MTPTWALQRGWVIHSDGSTAARPARASAPRSTWLAWTAAVAGVLCVVALQLFPGDALLRIRVTAILMPLLLLGSTYAAYRATRVARAKSHRMWRIITIMLLLFAVGMVYRAYHILAFGTHPAAGSLEDWAYVLAFLAMVPVALLMTERYESMLIRKARHMVDFVAILVLALTVVYMALGRPMGLFDSSRPVLESVIFIAYPVFNTAVIAYLLAFKRGRWYADERILFLALMLGAVGVTFMIYAVGVNQSGPGTRITALANVTLTASFGLFGVAAVYRARRRSADQRVATPAIEPPHFPSMLAMFVALVALPVLVVSAASLEDPTDTAVLVTAAALLTGATVGRGILVNVENRQLLALSYSDPLTGLLNDRYFRERLNLEVDTAAREGGTVTLYVIDIDGFGDYIRTHEYADGDRRLTSFARAMSGVASEPDLVFRIGTDDFARIMPSAGPEQALEECRTLTAALETLAGLDEQLTFSVGVANYPGDAPSADELTRLAEGALYWAKAQGHGTFVIYNEGVEALDSQEHIELVRERSHQSLVEALAHAVDARDAYTRFHSANVAALVTPVGVAAGLREQEATLLSEAAMLHDVGKIGIPDAILRKPGRLDPSEYALIKEHPVLGAKILSASVPPEMLPWVRQHHEHWDGSGYPDGLRGEEISLGARIMSACDAYDAITTDRPYRKGASPDEALAELRRCAGSQFDPGVVELLAGVVARGLDDQAAKPFR